jgi:hypothetical protein
MLKNMLDAEGKELKDDNKSNFWRSSMWIQEYKAKDNSIYNRCCWIWLVLPLNLHNYNQWHLHFLSFTLCKTKAEKYIHMVSPRFWWIRFYLYFLQQPSTLFLSFIRRYFFGHSIYAYAMLSSS